MREQFNEVVQECLRTFDGILIQPVETFDDLYERLITEKTTLIQRLTDEILAGKPTIITRARMTQNKSDLVIMEPLKVIRDAHPEGSIQIHLPSSDQVWSVTWGNYRRRKKTPDLTGNA